MGDDRECVLQKGRFIVLTFLEVSGWDMNDSNRERPRKHYKKKRDNLTLLIWGHVFHQKLSPGIVWLGDENVSKCHTLLND